MRNRELPPHLLNSEFNKQQTARKDISVDYK